MLYFDTQFVIVFTLCEVFFMMEVSEVLRQVLDLEDDGSDWNMSDEDGEDGELDDNTAETTSLDPLDAAQVDDVLPGEQLLESSSLEQESNACGTSSSRSGEGGSATSVTIARSDGVDSAASPTMSISNTDTHATRVHSDNIDATSHATASSSTGASSTTTFSQHVGPTISLPASAKALDYFMLFFDEDLLQHIVDQTNLYAQQNPVGARYAWYDTTTSEIKAFFGLIIAMGIKRLPSYTDYWSSNPLLGTPELVAGFPLNRFRHLLTRIHFNNNENAPSHGTTG